MVYTLMKCKSKYAATFFLVVSLNARRKSFALFLIFSDKHSI